MTTYIVSDGYNNELNNQTQIPSVVGTFSNSLRIKITSSDPITLNSLNIYINDRIVVSGGEVLVDRFNGNFISNLSTEKIVQIYFTSPLDKFESYELVKIRTNVLIGGLPEQLSTSFRIEDTLAPTLEEKYPLDGYVDVHPKTPMFFRFKDRGSLIDSNQINVIVRVDSKGVLSSEDAIVAGEFQTNYKGTLTPVGSYFDVFLQRLEDFPSKSVVEVQAQALDNEGNSVVGSYSFEIFDIEPPSISGIFPSPNSFNVDSETTIGFMWSDTYGSFLNLDTLQVKINDQWAVRNGLLIPSVIDILTSSLTQTVNLDGKITNITLVLKPLNPLSSSEEVVIFSSINDNSNNYNERSFSFFVRDYNAPALINNYPNNNDTNILPSTSIRFSLLDELDGYGLDFDSLQIFIDGYSTLNQIKDGLPVDGYNWDYTGRAFSEISNNSTLAIETPTVTNSLYQITYPGFINQLTKSATNQLDISIECLNTYETNSEISVKVNISDLGGNDIEHNYKFYTGDVETIQTIASPSGGIFKNLIDGYGVQEYYKFLETVRITLSSNLPNCITFYTLDGTIPRISSNLEVIGSTKVYTDPLIINRSGSNILRFFSIDSAGNRESVKQEIYTIKSYPPVAEENNSISIIADINLASTIIPLEFVDGLKAGQLVRILDDLRPPVYTVVLTVNQISSPLYVVVQDSVERLKTSRNARLEFIPQPIDTSKAIDFDTTQIGEHLYIGSRTDGLKQADSVIENLRILNRASSDEEILADYTLQVKGLKFYNQSEDPFLSDNLSSIEKRRVNLPDQTLLLLDLDGSVESKKRLGDLQNNTRPIVDTNSASNDIIFTIYIKQGEVVDRELLRQVLQNYAPADLNIVVKYEELS